MTASNSSYIVKGGLSDLGRYKCMPAFVENKLLVLPGKKYTSSIPNSICLKRVVSRKE